MRIKPKVNKQTYTDHINAIKNHIQLGDCYELNYCMEYYDDNAYINPISTYIKLKQASPTPFHALYKTRQQYLLCASPERYIKRVANKIVSQPIKGTIKRNLTNTAADEALKQQLLLSQKERSENIMVVDLVRNDLSKICERNSVTVSEFLKIYSFPQLHHLISTVEGILQPNISVANIVAATFPMGSMTGAPKKRVLELIAQYETSNRGLFSGSIGYIAPNGDFDFNVVIRSILYNAHTNYVQYLVGSGITIYSDAAQEYEECLLKAEAMAQVLL